jgi:hypothetical protein
MIAFLDVIRLDTVTAPTRIPSQSPVNNDEGIIIMTTTGEDTRPRPLIGQAVGQAQASLTRLLTGILAGTGTSHPVWLGLQRLNALGGQPAREAYEADLSYWLQLDGPAAARLAGDVVAAGLAASGDDGSVALSAGGRTLRRVGAAGRRAFQRGFGFRPGRIDAGVAADDHHRGRGGRLLLDDAALLVAGVLHHVELGGRCGSERRQEGCAG